MDLTLNSQYIQCVRIIRIRQAPQARYLLPTKVDAKKETNCHVSRISKNKIKNKKCFKLIQNSKYLH